MLGSPCSIHFRTTAVKVNSFLHLENVQTFAEFVKKLRPKEIRFLEEYARTGDHAQAYLTAGFRVKSREVARVNGYRLLRKLDERMDYKEILAAVGLSDRRVAEVMKHLVEHEDPKVRVQALHIATKASAGKEKTWRSGRVFKS
jgi:hypothetical protein